ncbi:MAG: GTPase, partial [Candidatus Latescibacterota bacterium]
DALVADKLFATLDTMTRRMTTENHTSILLVDTVGFIRKLPHHLVESFKATLDDIAEARLYLHVVDVSHPGYQEQMEVVNATLAGIDNPQVDTIHVFNKIDKVGPSVITSLQERYPGSAFISANKGVGLEELTAQIEQFFFGKNLVVVVELSAGDGKSIAKVQSLLHNITRTFRDDLCILAGTIEADQTGRLDSIPGVKIKYRF